MNDYIMCQTIKAKSNFCFNSTHIFVYIDMAICLSLCLCVCLSVIFFLFWSALENGIIFIIELQSSFPLPNTRGQGQGQCFYFVASRAGPWKSLGLVKKKFSDSCVGLLWGSQTCFYTGCSLGTVNCNVPFNFDLILILA